MNTEHIRGQHAMNGAEAGPALNRLALSATTHCLTGCGIGEILGLAIATALGWGNLASIILAVVLAFFFGYTLTLWPLLRSRVAPGAAMGLAFAADTLSITVMEIVDKAVVLLIPARWRPALVTCSSGPASRWGWRSRSWPRFPSTAG